jgi:hypothetical protein
MANQANALNLLRDQLSLGNINNPDQAAPENPNVLPPVSFEDMFNVPAPPQMPQLTRSFSDYGMSGLRKTQAYLLGERSEDAERPTIQELRHYLLGAIESWTPIHGVVDWDFFVNTVIPEL